MTSDTYFTSLETVSILSSLAELKGRGKAKGRRDYICVWPLGSGAYLLAWV